MTHGPREVAWCAWLADDSQLAARQRGREDRGQTGKRAIEALVLGVLHALGPALGTGFVPGTAFRQRIGVHRSGREGEDLRVRAYRKRMQRRQQALLGRGEVFVKARLGQAGSRRDSFDARVEIAVGAGLGEGRREQPLTLEQPAQRARRVPEDRTPHKN